MPAYSRFAITTPLENGSIPQIHSKHPQGSHRILHDGVQSNVLPEHPVRISELLHQRLRKNQGSHRSDVLCDNLAKVRSDQADVLLLHPALKRHRRGQVFLVLLRRHGSGRMPGRGYSCNIRLQIHLSGIKTFITFVKDRDCNFMTYSLYILPGSVDNNFTFVINCVKLVLNRSVKNFTDMFDLEACVECINALIRIRCISRCPVWYTPSIQLMKLWNLRSITGSKSGCMFFTCNFNNIGDAVLASKFHVVYFRSNAL